MSFGRYFHYHNGQKWGEGGFIQGMYTLLLSVECTKASVKLKNSLIRHQQNGFGNIALGPFEQGRQLDTTLLLCKTLTSAVDNTP